MFQILFGIPLSFAALATGLTLAIGGRWGVLRYPWVTIKLALLVSVILVGALLLGPSVDAIRSGDGDVEGRIVAGAGWDVAALTLADGPVRLQARTGHAEGTARGVVAGNLTRSPSNNRGVARRWSGTDWRAVCAFRRIIRILGAPVSSRPAVPPAHHHRGAFSVRCSSPLCFSACWRWPRRPPRPICPGWAVPSVRPRAP